VFFVPPFFFVKFVRYLECCLGDLFGNSILVVFCCTELIVCVLCDDLMTQRLELVRPLRRTICGISMWWSLARLSRHMKVVTNLTVWFCILKCLMICCIHEKWGINFDVFSKQLCVTIGQLNVFCEPFWKDNCHYFTTKIPYLPVVIY